MKPTRLSFLPALPCVDCLELASRGLICPISPQVWQLLPLCDKDIKEPELASEADAFAAIGHLQQLATSRIQAIGQLQRRRRRIARAYVRLHRRHAYIEAQRALRWRLRSICQRQEEVARD